MNHFESANININSVADSNDLMDVLENTESYYFQINEQENENENPIPLVNDEISNTNNSLSFNYTEMNNMYSSIVDDINNIYKDYPSSFETYLGINMGFENTDDNISQNQQSTSNVVVVNREENYNTNEFIIVDSDTESISFLGAIESVPIVISSPNEQEAEAEVEAETENVNVNDENQNDIITISDDEDENSVQLNGEQNNSILISDTEEEETSPAPIVQLTRIHELRSAKNIKKILPRFKTKVQENLQFLSTKRKDFVVRSTDGYKLLAEDLVKLITPKAWLTDVIILHYFLLLGQHNKQVLLLDPDMLRSCVQKGFVPECYQEKLNKVCQYNKIIIPINPNHNHWALVVLEIREGKMNIIDSIIKTNSEELNQVNKFVDLAFKRIIPRGFESVKLNSPLQSNTDDCGVFTCTNARYYLFNRQPDYAQRDIPLLRHRIAWELIHNTLIPF